MEQPQEGSVEHTAVGELLLRTFGPVGDALAMELARLPKMASVNLARLVERVRARRRRDDANDISARLLHRVLDEAAWSEHEVVAEYLSGVLASSGTRETNDRALGIVSLVQRLSAIQLRAHYLIYRELVILANPIISPSSVDLRFSVNRAKYHLEFPLSEFVKCLDISSESKLDQRDILNHIVLGLAKEEVVDHDSWDLVTDFWNDPSASSERISFHPTPLGAELFMWGCASPSTDQSQLFDPGLELTFDLDIPRPSKVNLDSDMVGTPMDLEEAVSLLNLEDAERLFNLGLRMMESPIDHAYGLIFRGFSHALNRSWNESMKDFTSAASLVDKDRFERTLGWFDFLRMRRPSEWNRINDCAAAFEVAYRSYNSRM